MKRGDTFRFALGYQLGQVSENRKPVPCALCGERIEPATFKGVIRYARRSMGETWYVQTNLCLVCVEKHKANKLPGEK